MMSMRRFGFVARRLIQTVPLLAVVLFVVFVLVRLAPGSPARAQLGLNATPARVTQLNHELGLDKPLLGGYLSYSWHALQGDLGNSVKAQTPVATVISRRAGVTLWLLVCAITLSLSMAVPLAVLAAKRADRAVDHAIRTVSVLGLTVPTFWLGLMLVSFVALPTGWFPVSGFGSGFLEHLHSIFLPALTLAVAITPIQIRALRLALITVLESDFVAALSVVGLSQRRVILRHVLPNALLSSLSLLAAQVGFVLFAEVVIENTFALPGLGQAMLQAVSERDYPVVQGITLLSALAIITLNALVDIMYVALDPRVQIR
jgi:peptide/nickel transport system permease protein